MDLISSQSFLSVEPYQATSSQLPSSEIPQLQHQCLHYSMNPQHTSVFLRSTWAPTKGVDHRRGFRGKESSHHLTYLLSHVSELLPLVQCVSFAQR